jgi:glycosyltransferase involved in cell wall biosynthesis
MDRKVKSIECDEEGNQRFYRVPYGRDYLDFLTDGWCFRRSIMSLLARIQPDLVHAWGTEGLYSAVLEDVNVPCLLSVQGCLTAFRKVDKLNWRQNLLLCREPSRLRAADRITCESPWSAEQVAAIHPAAQIDVVDYGVHPSFYQTKWFPNPNHPILLYSGSLDKRKGVDLLIEAMRLLPERHWELRVVGDGPLRKEFENAGIPGLKMLGVLPWSELHREMSAAWALVTPTRADTGPTVVKEARVVGLPVIGTVNGGLRDYIKDGLNGRIVSPLDARNLASACAEMMSSYDKILSLGGGQHTEDRQYFRPERTAAHFSRIYLEMIRDGATANPV